MSNKTTSGAKAPNNRPGRRLGTQFRGHLAEAYDRRGHGGANLYLGYSPKCQANVCLPGDLHYFHYLLVEGDPQIKQVDYNPRGVVARLAGDLPAKLVHAQIRMRDGTLVWRRLVRHGTEDPDEVRQLSVAVGKGLLSEVSRLEILTDQQLTDQPTFLRNMHSALPWVVSAKHWPLHTYRLRLLSSVRKQRCLTFRQVLEMGQGNQSALYAAAALTMAFKGEVISDLRTQTFGALTLFHRQGG